MMNRIFLGFALTQIFFQAFGILVSNALRVAALNSIGDFVLFLGKITIMAATGAVGVVWFRVNNT